MQGGHWFSAFTVCQEQRWQQYTVATTLPKSSAKTEGRVWTTEVRGSCQMCTWIVTAVRSKCKPLNFRDHWCLRSNSRHSSFSSGSSFTRPSLQWAMKVCSWLRSSKTLFLYLGKALFFLIHLVLRDVSWLRYIYSSWGLPSFALDVSPTFPWGPLPFPLQLLLLCPFPWGLPILESLESFLPIPVSHSLSTSSLTWLCVSALFPLTTNSKEDLTWPELVMFFSPLSLQPSMWRHSVCACWRPDWWAGTRSWRCYMWMGIVLTWATEGRYAAMSAGREGTWQWVVHTYKVWKTNRSLLKWKIHFRPMESLSKHRDMS